MISFHRRLKKLLRYSFIPVSYTHLIILEEKLNAEYAVQQTADYFVKAGPEIDKNYIQGHEADVKDVALRLIRILSRSWKDKLLSDEPFIMAAPELYPSEAMQLEKSKVLGFVTRYGTLSLIHILQGIDLHMQYSAFI